MYVVNSFGAGGAERHLLAVVGHMVRRGHSVLVVALTSRISGGAKNLTAEFADTGATLEVLDYPSARVWRDIGRWFKLASLAKSWNPDIIHSHLPRADLVASIVKALSPRIVWVSTIHDAYEEAVYSGYWIFPWLGWNWRRANHVVAVSGRAQRWASRNLRLSGNQTSVIYHGIADAPTLLERAVGSNSSSHVIGCLARFEQRKGVATLIKAMVEVCGRFPSARLVLAGSDPTGYAREMSELADALNIGHAVEVRGFCDVPLDFLRSIDTFAFASSAEGFGIVLLEAMVVGLPVVASNIYPINHIVDGGRTGLLAAPDDPHAFASAMIDLLENPDKARAMGEAGRRRCLDEFSESKMIEAIDSLYSKLCSH